MILSNWPHKGVLNTHLCKNFFIENRMPVLLVEIRIFHSPSYVHSCTMFTSYQIAILPFQFSYWIGLLFPLEHTFFGMIFVTERSWKAPILKVIRGISDSYQSASKRNGNTSGRIIGYDFKLKWKQITCNYKFFNEILVMFDKEMNLFCKRKQLKVKHQNINYGWSGIEYESR